MSTGIVQTEIKAWRGCSVEWYDGLSMLLGRKNLLYSANQVGGPLTLVGEVPIPVAHRALSMARFGQRFLRSMFYNVLPLGDGRYFTTFGRRVGVIGPEGWTEVTLPRPSRVLRGGIGVAPDGALYFGEYWGNPQRIEMHVYRWVPGDDRVQVAHTFPAGAICHVHSVTWDPFRQGLICLTGDRRGECRILLTRDGFQSFEVIGAGTEDWRAVSIVPRSDGWLFATDAEFQLNHIVLVEATSGARRVLGKVEGPVYYSKAWGEDALFGVTAERCVIMPHPRGVLYRVTGDRMERVLEYEKDLSRARIAWELFMPGTLHFAAGPGDSGHCFISGVGLRGLDHRVVMLERSKAADGRPEEWV